MPTPLRTGLSWRQHTEPEDVNLSGFVEIQRARIDNNYLILRLPNGLIDTQTTSGTLVIKYYNQTTDEVRYVIGSTIVSGDTVQLEDIWIYSLKYEHPNSWIYDNN